MEGAGRCWEKVGMLEDGGKIWVRVYKGDEKRKELRVLEGREGWLVGVGVLDVWVVDIG